MAKTQQPLFLKRSTKVQDCLFLSVLVSLSVVPYAWDLGFYSDDWSFLAIYSLAEDQSLLGLFRSHYDSWTQMRPGQIFYQASLYWLFGTDPLGYHLVNAAVLALSIVFVYLVLRELGQSRLLAVAIPALYGMLPHYSTDRFWPATSQITLAMLFYFLSVYADLRTTRSRSFHLWLWKTLSLSSLVGSILAYELTIPLFLFSPLIVSYVYQRRWTSVQQKRPSILKLTALISSHWLMLMGLIAFKLLTTVRLGHYGLIEQITWFGQFIREAFVVGYGWYGLGLPATVFTLFRDYPDWRAFAVTGVFGLLLFWYLQRVGGQFDAISWTSWLRLIGGGLAVFGLGYAIFLTNRNVHVGVTTGIGNRIAIAAAIGVALSLVGAFGWISDIWTSIRTRRLCFCALVTVFCMSGFLINNGVASFWITAYEKQQVVLADIKREFPTLDAGTRFILDGVCPYVGPAVVFESSWDLQGALRLLYRDDTISANVVKPGLALNERGLTSSIYGFQDHYSYGEGCRLGAQLSARIRRRL